MLSSIVSKFRSFKDVLKYIKHAPVGAIMRLFTSRKSRYDDLMRRMDGFVTVLHASDDGATVVDVSGDTMPRRSGKGVKAVKFRDGSAIPIGTFKAPNRKKLAKDVQMFEEADQYLDELEEMILRLSKKKDPASRKFVKEMRTYHSELTDKRDALHDAMEDISNKHLPAEMKSMTVALIKHLNATIPADSYDSMSRDVYVTSHNSLAGESDKEPIEFTCYVYVEGLREGDFKTDELILALTGTVHESAEGKGDSSFYLTFHLTALSRFMPPGSFKEGRPLAGATLGALTSSMEREATKLISMNSTMPHLGRRKLKVTAPQIRNSGILDVDGVLDVSVEEDTIVIKTLSMDDEIIVDDLWPEIIVYLRKVLRAPRKSSFVYTIEKQGKFKHINVSNISNPASV